MNTLMFISVFFFFFLLIKDVYKLFNSYNLNFWFLIDIERKIFLNKSINWSQVVVLLIFKWCSFSVAHLFIYWIALTMQHYIDFIWEYLSNQVCYVQPFIIIITSNARLRMNDTLNHFSSINWFSESKLLWNGSEKIR